MSECLGRFTLVSWATDELEVERRDSVETHLETCEHCRAQLEDVNANLEHYRVKLPTHSEALRQRLGRERRGLFGQRLVAPLTAAAAGAAVVLLAVLVWPGDQTPGGPFGPTNVKGALGVRVVAQQGRSQAVVHSGARLTSDHRLRIELTTETPGFVTVFSIDAGGRLSPLYPHTDAEADASPWPLPAAGVHTLPDAVSLDLLPGGEWLVIFFSSQSFGRHEAHAGLVSAGSQPLDEAALRERARGLGGVAEVVHLRRAAHD